MLERRVSNQRQDLSSDQQMNYLLSWFVNWSDLQKVSHWVTPEANQQVGPSTVRGPLLNIVTLLNALLIVSAYPESWSQRIFDPVSIQEDFVPVLAEKMSNKWATGDNLSKLFHSFFEMTPSSSPVSKFKMAISRTLIHFNAILWNVEPCFLSIKFALWIFAL